MPHDDLTSRIIPSRRAFLAFSAAGASTLALAACSKAPSASSAGGTVASTTAGDSSSVASSSAASTSSAATAASSAPATSSAAASSSAAAVSGLAKLSDIKVGSAISAKSKSGKPVILARPTATTAVGFSAICTHQGCTVAPAGNQLDCPCHGSVFNATTGAVIQGPAPRALDSFSVTVTNGEVVEA